MRMKLTKAERGIKVSTANIRHIFNKTDMRVDNFNQIFIVFFLGDDVNQIEEAKFIKGTAGERKRHVFAGSMGADSDYDAFILDLIGIILKFIPQECGGRL
jgi:hypothetical protein